MTGWIIGGILVLFLLLALLLPSKLQIDYKLQDGKSALFAKLGILGIPVKIAVPLEKKEKKADGEEKKTKLKSPKEFVEFTKKLYDAFGKARSESKGLFRSVKRHVSCCDAKLALQFGTGNPATTGMLNGPVWTGASLLMKMAETTFRVDNKSLSVEPAFDRTCLNLHSKLSFRFQLIYALWLLCKLKKVANKFKID